MVSVGSILWCIKSREVIDICIVKDQDQVGKDFVSSQVICLEAFILTPNVGGLLTEPSQGVP